MILRKGREGRMHNVLVLAAIWATLLSAPYWMPLAGGYTALGTRVLVLALALCRRLRNRSYQ